MTMTREENDEDERQRFDYRRARVTHASVSTSARTACVADGAYIITAYLPHVVCAYACERRTGACAPHAPALSRVWALDHAARVSSLAFDASSCVLASGDDAGVIVIRNVRDDDDDDAPQERIAHGVAIVALARERSGTKRRSSGLAWSDVHGTLTLRVNGILGHKHVVIDTNSGVIDTIAFGVAKCIGVVVRCWCEIVRRRARGENRASRTTARESTRHRCALGARGVERAR